MASSLGSSPESKGCISLAKSKFRFLDPKLDIVFLYLNPKMDFMFIRTIHTPNDFRSQNLNPDLFRLYFPAIVIAAPTTLALAFTLAHPLATCHSLLTPCRLPLLLSYSHSHSRSLSLFTQVPVPSDCSFFLLFLSLCYRSFRSCSNSNLLLLLPCQLPLPLRPMTKPLCFP